MTCHRVPGETLVFKNVTKMAVITVEPAVNYILLLEKGTQSNFKCAEPNVSCE